MKEFGKFLGWVGTIFYIIAIANYLIKYVNKKFISKLSSDKKKYVSIYRVIMKYVVKYHKIVGVVASIAIMAHFYIMYTTRGLSVPGFAAAIVMWILFILGIYGVYVKKNVRGKWVKVHRLLAFALIVLIIIHLLFKRLLIF